MVPLVEQPEGTRFDPLECCGDSQQYGPHAQRGGEETQHSRHGSDENKGATELRKEDHEPRSRSYVRHSRNVMSLTQPGLRPPNLRTMSASAARLCRVHNGTVTTDQVITQVAGSSLWQDLAQSIQLGGGGTA